MIYMEKFVFVLISYIIILMVGLSINPPEVKNIKPAFSDILKEKILRAIKFFFSF